MSKKKIYVFLFLLVVLFGLMFTLENKNITRKITIETLENGLKVLVKKNLSNEIVAIRFFVNGGSALESLDEAGLTNLTAHLLFKGTKDKNFSQIAEEFDSLGGVWGGSVERDFLEIHLDIPKKNWKSGLKLLAEVLISPSFSQEEIEKEKWLILQQIKSIEDDPFELAYRAFNENIYGSHSYAKPTYGFLNTVAQFNRHNLEKQYRKYFCSQNALIIFVGDLNPKEVIRFVKNCFMDLPEGERLSFRKQTWQSLEKRKIIKKDDLKQAMIFLGFKADSVKDKDYAALKLINVILGGGMSSRLFENVRDQKGLGYALGSFYPTRLDTSTLVLFLGVQPERVKEAEAAFWEEIEKIKSEEISEDEFNRAKNYLIGNFYLTQQRNKEQAYYLGWFETLGLGYDYSLTYLEEIKNLEISQVKEVALKLFNREEAFLLILTPGISNTNAINKLDADLHGFGTD